MTFERPEFLWISLGVVVALAVAFTLDHTRRERQIAKMGDSQTLFKMMRSLSPKRRVLKTILQILSILFVCIALAGPQMEGESTFKQRGMDVAVVLDFSKSMLARDVYPSRFERMIAEADDLLLTLPADRITTLVFAGATVHFPLTHDKRAARLLYSGLEPRDLAPGSNLAEAVRRARCLLAPDGSASCKTRRPKDWGYCEGGAPLEDGLIIGADRGRAIVLFTDAEDTEGGLRGQVQAALDADINVFVVGIGTTSGELIPEYDDDGIQVGTKEDSKGAFIKTSLDDALLNELDEMGERVRVFRFDGGQGPAKQLRKELSELKRGDAESRVVTEKLSVYYWFLFPAFMLLLIEGCLSERYTKVTRA